MKMIRNIATLACCPDQGKQSYLHLIHDAAIVWEDATILWLGQESELPLEYCDIDSLDAQKKLLLPGLIDCHTHLAFGGWRADEFTRRIHGESYEAIASSGGGIASTVKHTGEMSITELKAKCAYFLTKMMALGITSIECKSGYGLNTDDELKILQCYDELNTTCPLNIVSTFLGAHVVPSDVNRTDYIKLLTEDMIPRLAQYQCCDFCDVFVAPGAFTADEALKILAVAKQHGLQAKLHVDQLSDNHGGALASACKAISADHLEHISAHSILALKASHTIAVLLPLASLCTYQPPLDARKLIAAEVPVAVATDFNPGSAPSYHLPFVMNMACLLNHMTAAEVLKAVTIYAAKAMGIDQQRGSIMVGKKADFILIDSPGIDHWLYHFEANANCLTVINGTVVFKR